MLIRKTCQFIDLPGVRPRGRQLRHSAFYQYSKLKQVAHLLQAHLWNQIASVGYNFEKMFMMKAVAGLAKWRASDPIAAHDFFFRETHAFFNFAPHNSFLYALVGFFGKGAHGGRLSCVPGHGSLFGYQAELKCSRIQSIYSK